MFWFVCSFSIIVLDVFLGVYFFGGMDKCCDVVLVFWGSILKVYKEFEGILWLLIVDDIELSVENILFEDFIRFLSLFIVGKEENEISEKVKWLIFFIG